MTHLVFDIETNGFLDVLDRVHCVAIHDLDTAETQAYTGLPEEAVHRLETADLLVGHNASRFDIPAIRKVRPTFAPQGIVRDTLLMSHLQYPDIRDADIRRHQRGKLPADAIGRYSLRAWGLRLDVHKGDYDGGWDAWSEEMQEYCAKDAEVAAALWRFLNKTPYAEAALEMEHRFQDLMFKMEQAGFPFDEAGAARLYADIVARKTELEAGMHEVFPARVEEMKSRWWMSGRRRFATKKEGIEAGVKAADLCLGPHKTKTIPFNPGSRDEIARRFKEKYNWRPSQWTDGGKPKVDEAVLASLPFPEAKVLSEYLMLDKRAGQIYEGTQAWVKLVQADGRIRGRVRTAGAVTRRCTHSNPNVAQVPRVGSPYGKECRALWTAPEGYALVGADASGLELRCLAHYLHRYDGGAYAKELLEGDVHTAVQEAVGLATRDHAKTFIYAFLYGAGDAKIGKIVGKGRAAGSQLKKRFLAKFPALKRLTDDVKAAASTRGYLVGVDGGRLTVRHQHAALNTLLQSAGAIAVKTATVVLADTLETEGYTWGEDYWFAAHVHDEIQSVVKESKADEFGATACKSFRLAGAALGFRCPLDGEYKVGRNWAETH